MATEPGDLRPEARPRPTGVPPEEIPVAYPEQRRRGRRLLSDQATRAVAQGLGWFSIGLGVAQLLAPDSVSRLIGARPRPMLMRALGARELLTGLGILSRRKPAGWLGARVGGDLMDLSLLGLAFNTRGANPTRLAGATAAVLGVTALDALCTRELSRSRIGRTGVSARVSVEKSIVIDRPPEDCYRFWRHLDNLPRFMQHIESIQVIDDRRSHWKVKAPGGRHVEWDSEITEDRPNERIAWRTVGEADVPNSGVVRFEPAPGGRGTIVRASLQYEPPGGKPGVLAAKLFGEEPDRQMREDLRRFKQILETGEVPTTRGQPSGRRSFLGRTMRRRVFHEG
jgi:uncharacterized membrane protein